jgi:TRAP-type C4-dicarboxylate transport system substrate-binding protein
LAVILLGCVLAAPAAAEPTVLRFATVGPPGTAWARLLQAMGRDLAAESHGQVTSKWYLGGIAGNEMEMLQRLRRGQLDAVVSGGMLCMKLSPSMRALRLLGLFQSREEASYVLGRLRPNIDAEFAKNGFHNVGEATHGPDLNYRRRPNPTMAELRRARLWFWDLDETMKVQLAALGVPAVGRPVEEAGRAYEAGQIDGFLALPSAALAFQWSAQTPYLSDMHVSYLAGCMVLTDAAWDGLSNDSRVALTSAAAKLQARLEQLGRDQDRALLGGLFAHQGVKRARLAPGFFSEFIEAAGAARRSVRDKLIPREIMDRVIGWVADYRAEYGGRGARR